MTYENQQLENGKTKIVEKIRDRPQEYLFYFGGKVPMMDLVDTDKALIDAGEKPITSFKQFIVHYFQMFNEKYKTSIEPMLISKQTQYINRITAAADTSAIDEKVKGAIIKVDAVLKKFDSGEVEKPKDVSAWLKEQFEKIDDNNVKVALFKKYLPDVAIVEEKKPLTDIFF